jgi:hypothetical protein
VEHIVWNLTTAKTRREFRDGREYLVAPATLIVPGVLNGSQGALYYPPDECARNFREWNRTVSASTPGVWERQGLGFNVRIRMNGRLASEMWCRQGRQPRSRKNHGRRALLGLDGRRSSRAPHPYSRRYLNRVKAEAGVHDPKAPWPWHFKTADRLLLPAEEVARG